MNMEARMLAAFPDHKGVPPPWLDSYMHELGVFPNGRFDDQVDSTSQALEHFKGAIDVPNAVLYYQQELEKMRLGQR